MEKRDRGFALLLMGIIFSAPGDTLFWYIGAIMGIIGLILVFCSRKEK